MYIEHKKISDHINKELHVEIDKYFSVQLKSGIIVTKNVNLFAHTSINSRKNVLGADSNFGMLIYESINSPFLLWKFCLNVLYRIVFNVSQQPLKDVKTLLTSFSNWY